MSFTAEVPIAARITPAATTAPRTMLRMPAQHDVVALPAEHAREAALDDADRARRGPEHRDDRDDQQLRRALPRPDDEALDVAVDLLGQVAVDLLRDRQRGQRVVEAQRDGGDPERERRERQHEVVGQRRDVVGDALPQ